MVTRYFLLFLKHSNALTDNLKKVLVLLLLLLLSAPAYSQKTPKRLVRKAQRASEKFAKAISAGTMYQFKVDSFKIEQEQKRLTFFMNRKFSYLPFRPNLVEEIKNKAKSDLGRRFKKYTIQLKVFGQEVSELIPNIYRNDYLPIDSVRLTKRLKKQIPLARKLHSKDNQQGSLYGKNIALWHSHGWYYENTLDRWEWQRAPVFQTVEDLWPTTFVLTYLAPMLENSGAYVLLPRERDIQKHEVIVDAEKSTYQSGYLEQGDWEAGETTGFALKYPFWFNGENPFTMGQSRRIKTNMEGNARIQYIPDIPATGWYAVYISYENNPENITNAHYKIYHTGGETEFLVNQTMGGGTWVYLGTFHFLQGLNPEQGQVELSNRNLDESKWVSADAVRFGGGVGNIVRGPDEDISELKEIRDSMGHQIDSIQWQQWVSGKPRYQEGARYYLQYAGMPDTLVYNLNAGQRDYNDDFQSRGEWVNYLMGAPNGPNRNPEAPGLNIPVDMALAFHTDAGTTPDDSTIGTLTIYNTTRDSAFFPNGHSKWASRDLADIVQTQIVSDIRRLYDPKWTRRGMRNRQYSEAWRPHVPTLLLELLSHQNFADLYQAMDPQFQFDVSRAIYKGIVKFLSFQDGHDFAVQPLPVNGFQMKMEGDSLRLSWKPVMDDLEPTANPTAYKLYTRKETLGFDNGQYVNDTTILIPVTEPGVIYSFKVTALNNGGESFPSEILSYCKSINNKKPVLIINAFDRVSAPAAFDNGKQAGFIASEDEGVSYCKDLSFIGEQYDFERNSPWLDDDAPGFGASYMDKSDKVRPGNSFDFPIVHGQALRDNGYGFISMSDEAFENQQWNPDEFTALDIIFGEEKTIKKFYGISKNQYSLLTPGMRSAISKYLAGQTPCLFLSGAYLGADLALCGDTVAGKFAKEKLHYTFRTNHATRVGEVYAVRKMRNLFNGNFTFNTGYHPVIYKAESPDAIEPSGEGAETLFRYKGNNKSAGIIYQGEYKSVVLGFPFETLLTAKDRQNFMRQLLEFFKKTDNNIK